MRLNGIHECSLVMYELPQVNERLIQTLHLFLLKAHKNITHSDWYGSICPKNGTKTRIQKNQQNFELKILQNSELNPG